MGKSEGLLPPGTRKTARNNEVSVLSKCPQSKTPSIRTLRGKFEGLLPPGTRKTARNNEVSVKRGSIL